MVRDTRTQSSDVVVSTGNVPDGLMKPENEVVSKKTKKNITKESVNPLLLNFKALEYAARGPVIMRAIQLEKEMAQGKVMPFKTIFKANLGDAQAMGQPPITFLRQVLACVSEPNLIQKSDFPEDVKRRANEILSSCRGRSVGAYTDSRGIELIRRHVAEYITRRDDGIPASADDIILFAGASDGIRACLKLLKQSNDGNNNSQTCHTTGVLTPIPEYPLYRATLSEYGMAQVGYYLEHSEAEGWTINIDELKRAVRESKEVTEVKAIVIINPGNPTGNVLTRKTLESIIKFAYHENLVIFADEVYQDNVYNGNEFNSMKKVMMQMESPYNTVELFSFYSCSKGFICECGLRGAYAEVANLDPVIKDILVTSISAKLCPTILGQAAVECAVNPPKPGDESYESFIKEKMTILKTLEENSTLIVKALKALPGIKCAPVQGAMYVYPEIKLPAKFIKRAQEQNLEPDVFYALQLLETTGICVVPGSGVGQYPGTYHFRSTVLVPQGLLKEMMDRFSSFHLALLEQYA